MNTLLQDAHYGFRMLLKRPAFTAMAVLSLALGIGVNTAIFTLINTILMGSLPYPEPDRLVAIWSVPPQHPDQMETTSVSDFMVWKDQNRSFEAMGGVVSTFFDFGVEENGFAADRILGENVTPGLFPALKVQPLMGRLVRPDEDEVDHAAPVMVISFRLWQSRFNGDKNILNRTVLVNGVKTSVVGVMAPGFRLTDDASDCWAPLPYNRFQLQGSARFLTVVARLRRGVSMGQAQGDMESIAGVLARRFPGRDIDHGKPWGIRMQPIREGLFGFMSKPLLLLQGAVGFVLLIACANVAALLLGRASARHNEVAVRCALGASRGRIVRQFLTESVLLSLMGGALGILLASVGVHTLVALAPSWFPRLHEISMDGRVLSFTALLSLLTGVIFGVGPAIQGSKSRFGVALKDSARGGTAGATRGRLRDGLVMIQVAMAFVLLAGAGLLIRSFAKMQGANLGCDPTGVMTFNATYRESQFGKPIGMYAGLPLWEINSVPTDTISRIFERLQSLPGVQSAAGNLVPPLAGAVSLPFTIEGRLSGDADALSAEFYPITPNYFNTMKIAILHGRDFTRQDTARAPWVAMVNETAARRFWPNEDPIGKRLKFDLSPGEGPREVIAVVHDSASSRLQTRQEAAVYVPFVQTSSQVSGPYTFLRLQLTFVVRTVGVPASLLPALRHAVAEIDPNLPVADIKTVEQYMAQEVEYPRYYSMLLGLFSVVALVLAAVGIYGVMAYAVAQRTREIGIRMALGAGQREVMKLIVRQAIVLVAGGLVLGLTGAKALTGYLSSELWEVTATDPVTLGAVSLLLVSIAVIACMVPALRAIRLDPTVALRYE
jgi:putative ABC transport system permease protein